MERIQEFSNVETEAEGGTAPESTGWPRSGCIEFQDVCMRYRSDTPLVLRGISLEVKGGSSLGLVGRTGSGKSSLLASLMRVAELSSGRILLDGIDIATVSLHSLRSAICIVPQDPTLFSGDIRGNIDPFGERTDDEIWAALRALRLEELIRCRDGQLLSEVKEDGANLSVGQRQLLCLARALMRRTRVIFLDEATQSLDLESERAVSDALSNSFSSATTITVAHRLSTIIQCDKVAVGNLWLYSVS